MQPTVYATAAIQRFLQICLTGQNHENIIKKLRAVMRGGGGGVESTSRSTSRYHNVSIILIEFIFADNNGKRNLTNYLTHNILYMKS